MSTTDAARLVCRGKVQDVSMDNVFVFVYMYRCKSWPDVLACQRRKNTKAPLYAFR